MNSQRQKQHEQSLQGSAADLQSVLWFQGNGFMGLLSFLLSGSLMLMPSFGHFSYGGFVLSNSDVIVFISSNYILFDIFKEFMNDSMNKNLEI